MSTYFEDIIKSKSEHLADLKRTTAEVERELSDARDSLQREFTRSRSAEAAEPGYAGDACQCEQCQPQQFETQQFETRRFETQDFETQDFETQRSPAQRSPAQRNQAPRRQAQRRQVQPDRRRVPSPRRPAYPAPRLDFEFAPDQAEPAETDRFDVGRYSVDVAPGEPGGPTADPDEDRTTILVNRGRSSAQRPKLAVSRKVVIAAIAVATLLVVLVLLVASGGGASWPSSVARVQVWIEQACQNPNVMSEPGQVNFACAKGSRQILWVFSLITSDNNPSFADTKTGRQGLEPITPGQGGQVASALNLHHPYDPSDPVDSIQVAARAINDIIGGATVTSTSGNPEVQPGLESSSANCLRYTGSAAMNARQGYPDVCARAITAKGQAALVRDVYREWVVGAPSAAARDAAVLFQNAKNPGDPQVQFILNHLPAAALSS